MNDQGLLITSETTPGDVVEFVERRLRNPVRINGTTVFNLSSYDVVEDDLRTAMDVKLTGDYFLIPHQVTSAHGFIMTFLPEKLKEADILVYLADREEYRAYSSLYAGMDGTERANVQAHLAEIVADEVD